MKTDKSLDYYPYPPYLNEIKPVHKHLTNLKRGHKIKKIKRKDQTMKKTKQTNWVKPLTGVVILVGLSYGITEFLGGSLKDAIFGGFMAGLLAALYLMEGEK